MIPLILPPLLVVGALALLAYLFFRRLPEVERRESERSGEPSGSLLSVSDRAKRVFLGMVERFARLFKLLSLKIHNKLNTLAARARSARLRAVDRIADRKNLRAEKTKLTSFQPEFPRVSGAPDSKEDARYRSERSSEENLPPLVSEPLQPILEEGVEREVRRRAADIGRKFGDAVRRLRPEKKPPIFPAQSQEETPLQKNQLEDILVERISMNPRDIEAYERLGDYYLEQNNLVDAKECYRQVLKLSPAYRLVKIKIRRLERLLEKERTP